jgi:hypothetical protein
MKNFHPFHVFIIIAIILLGGILYLWVDHHKTVPETIPYIFFYAPY